MKGRRTRAPAVLPCFIFTSLIALLIPPPLFAQLDGWITYTDKDRNRYYVSTTGRIYTEETPDFAYKAVSAEGIEYYLAQGETLLKRFYPKEGLLLLKSVRFLGDIDRSLYDYAARASTKINTFQKQQGTRFDGYNREASLLLCRSGDTTYVHNDYFGYSFKVKGRLEVMKTSLVHKEVYGRGGLLAGVKSADREGYDYLVLINAEQFRKAKIRGIRHFKEIIAARAGEDAYETQAPAQKQQNNREVAAVSRKFKDKQLRGKRLLTIDKGTGVSVIVLGADGGSSEAGADALIESFALTAVSR